MPSREGFTLDTAVKLARGILLNPLVNGSIAAILSSKPALEFLLSKINSTGPITIQPVVLSSAYLLTLGSFLFSVNDFLNRQFANNWVSDRTYDWDKEIVVVTGGSSGIGASVAKQLIQRNRRTRVVIVDIAPLAWEPGADARVSYFRCDLTDPRAIRDTFARIRHEVGDPTVVFNNAGLTRGKTIMDGSYADAEVTVCANLLAPMLVIKEVLPRMVQNDHGHIVHTGSLSCITPPAFITDYAATKAGLVALHEGLQLELKNIHRAPRVRLTCAILCFVNTPLVGGHPGVPNFLLPFLHVDSVGERFVNAVYSGYGSTIYMPGIGGLLTTLRGGPEWIFHIFRQATAIYGIEFRGRQAIDEQTGKLRV